MLVHKTRVWGWPLTDHWGQIWGRSGPPKENWGAVCKKRERVEGRSKEQMSTLQVGI